MFERCVAGFLWVEDQCAPLNCIFSVYYSVDSSVTSIEVLCLDQDACCLWSRHQLAVPDWGNVSFLR
jgi:hypothetical protein